MVYFCIIVCMICMMIMCGVCTFVVFEAKIITELQTSMERERLALQDTNIALSKAHNSLVESQATVVTRMESLELRLSGLSTAIPQQRKY